MQLSTLVGKLETLCNGNAWLAGVLGAAISESAGSDYQRLNNAERILADLISRDIGQKERLQAHRVLAVINAAQIKLLEELTGEDLDGDGVIGRNKGVAA